MSKTFKVFITKETSDFELDKSLVLTGCRKIIPKSVSIFWNYDNLNETYFFNYDVDGVNTKVTFKKGYYIFDTIKDYIENIGNMKLQEIKSTGKCKLRSDKKTNLKTLGPILGFSSNKVIPANTWVTSENVVNINNNLEFVNISCNLIDKSRNFNNGKRSDVLLQIPIPSNQTLKGSVSQYSLEEKNGVSLNNGVYNEIEFKVEGNNNSYIGNILFEFCIK